MSLARAIREVESQQLGMQASIATDISMFVDLIRGVPAVAELAKLAKNDPAVASTLLSRCMFFVGERGDFRYQHPRDVAVAAYLWILGVTNLHLARMAAHSVLTSPNRFWWARKAAKMVFRGEFRTLYSDTMSQYYSSGLTQAVSCQDEDVVMLLDPPLQLLKDGKTVDSPDFDKRTLSSTKDEALAGGSYNTSNLPQG